MEANVVTLKVVLRLEPHVAQVTVMVECLSLLVLLVPNQVVLLGEALAAVGTLEWPLSHVDAEMVPLQVVG